MRMLVVTCIYTCVCTTRVTVHVSIPTGMNTNGSMHAIAIATMRVCVVVDVRWYNNAEMWYRVTTHAYVSVRVTSMGNGNVSICACATANVICMYACVVMHV